METRNSFAVMLTGGHPNSLGRTVEVVDLVRADPARLDELYQCYFSEDEVVRLRTSNAMKRIWREHPDWIVPYIDRFLREVAAIPQASAQWTVAQLVDELREQLTPDQQQDAKVVLKRNLDATHDWIVINESLKPLGLWAETDAELRAWLEPRLARLANDPRKSVSKNAARLRDRLRKHG